MTTYDSIIEDVGVFGWWQATLLALISLPDIFYSFALILPVFTGATPPFYCKDSTNDSVVVENVTSMLVASQNNGSTAKLTDQDSVCDRCKMIEFDGSFTSVVTEWHLICDKDYVTELIVTIQMTGLLVGAGLFGQLSDTFGRKKTYFFVVALLGIAGSLSGFSPNWQMYAAMRFFVGISAGGYFCINCVYPLEFIGARFRTLCGTLGFWAIGEMLLALLAYYERRWRYLTVITSVLSFLCFAVLWLVPESPRWLANKGHCTEAKAIFSTIARRNNRAIPNMDALSAAIADDEEEERYTKVNRRYTYLDLFKSWSMALKTVIVLITWFTLFMAYYELSFNLRYLSGDRYINMLLAGVVDLVAMMLVILLNNVLGRRIMQASVLTITILTNLCLVILIMANKDSEYDTLYKICALLGKGATLSGTYVVQIFTAELYPTCIRNIACGAGSVAARIGGICAPQLLYLGTKYQIAPFFIIIALCLLTLPLFCALPETNGQPLEDSLSSKKSHTDVKLALIKKPKRSAGLKASTSSHH